MDVVGRNVVPFELPSLNEGIPHGLLSEALFSSRNIQPPKESRTNLTFPPYKVDKDTICFHPVNADSAITKAEIQNNGDSKERAPYDKFKGSLFLIGGHAEDTFSELLRTAPRNPKVVVVGRASGLSDADESLAEDFFKAGVKLDDITIVVPEKFHSAETRFKYSYEVPTDADVVYFGGGAQDKLRKEFDDHQLNQVKQLLIKGALVGGSSAGAAVMSEKMINGGDERSLESAHGFGLTPWAILDTHVGQRHREARDVSALYEIGDGTRPVIGLDEDTRVRFFWKDDRLLGEIGGKGIARIFQTKDMPPLSTTSSAEAKIVTDSRQRDAAVWELKGGDVFEIRLPDPKFITN